MNLDGCRYCGRPFPVEQERIEARLQKMRESAAARGFLIPPDNLASIRATAAACRVHHRTIRRRMDDGDIKPFDLRPLAFDLRVIAELMEAELLEFRE